MMMALSTCHSLDGTANWEAASLLSATVVTTAVAVVPV